MGFGNSETAEMLKPSSWQVGAEICRAGSTGQEAEPRNSEDPSNSEDPRNSEDPSLQYVQAHSLAGRASHDPQGALASLPDTNGAYSGRYLRLLQEWYTIDLLTAGCMDLEFRLWDWTAWRYRQLVLLSINYNTIFKLFNFSLPLT